MFINIIIQLFCFDLIIQLSWADIYFVALLDYMNFVIKSDLLEGRPNLQKLKEHVLTIPQIKSWIAKRPIVNA